MVCVTVVRHGRDEFVARDALAVLDRLDRLIQEPSPLSADEFLDLLAFVRDGLFDPRAKRANTCRLVPPTVPSALPVALFQGCR